MAKNKPVQVFGPPPYSLKYSNPKLYKQEMEKFNLDRKLWGIIKAEPMSMAEIETLEEYMEIKRRKSNGQDYKK